MGFRRFGCCPIGAPLRVIFATAASCGAAGGNAFDLASLSGHSLVLSGAVNLNQICYLRLVDIMGDGVTLDSSGNPIYDPTGFSNSADIDAVSVIHGIPEPSSIALVSIGLLCMGYFTRRRF